MRPCVAASSYIILRAFGIPQASSSFAAADCLARLKPGWRRRHNCSCTVFFFFLPRPSSSRYARIRWQTIHPGALAFYEAHIKHWERRWARRSPSVGRNTRASNGDIKRFSRHSDRPCHVTLMCFFFCFKTCAISLCPLSLLFQEALASADVRAVHGLSHDPMPVQGELSRYVLPRPPLSLI